MKLTIAEERARDFLCLALDIHDRDEILHIVDECHDLVGCFKLNSAFTMHGPALVQDILDRRGRVFLDLKFHDIPNTVAHYADVSTRLGVHIFNVHCAGGSEMMRAAVDSAHKTAKALGRLPPLVIGITILTSVSQGIMNRDIGVHGTVASQVLKWAKLAQASGLDGIVCSGEDLSHIKALLPGGFYYITPGVRPAGVSNHDQKRVFTPANAVRAGSSLLVIGRAILGAPDRRRAAYDILKDIAVHT